MSKFSKREKNKVERDSRRSHKKLYILLELAYSAHLEILKLMSITRFYELYKIALPPS